MIPVLFLGSYNQSLSNYRHIYIYMMCNCLVKGLEFSCMNQNPKEFFCHWQRSFQVHFTSLIFLHSSIQWKIPFNKSPSTVAGLFPRTGANILSLSPQDLNSIVNFNFPRAKPAKSTRGSLECVSVAAGHCRSLLMPIAMGQYPLCCVPRSPSPEVGTWHESRQLGVPTFLLPWELDGPRNLLLCSSHKLSL